MSTPATHLVGPVAAVCHGHGVGRHAAHCHVEAVAAALPRVAELVARLRMPVGKQLSAFRGG